MSVDFDRSRFRNGAEQSVEWKKPDAAIRTPNAPNLPAAADFDEISFKRNGDENTNVTINLFRQEMPDRYQFSPELADVVDMKEGTQQEAVRGLWEYIRQRGLQEDEEKRNFRCDDLLKKVRPSSYIYCRLSYSLTDFTGCQRRRCWIYPGTQRLCYPKPPPAPSGQLTVHHPRRRGVPQGSSADNL